MSICMRCKACRSEFKVGKRKCPKCSVTLKDNVSYRVSVRPVGGKPIKRTAKTLKDARSLEGRLLAQRDAGELRTKKESLRIRLREENRQRELEAENEKVNLPLSAAADKYLHWAKRNKRSFATDERLWRIHIKPVLGDKLMREVEPLAVDDLLDVCREKVSERTKRHLSPDTIHHIFKLTRRIYNWCIKEAKIYAGKNPCSGMRPAEATHDSSRELVLESEQLALFIEHVGNLKNQWMARPILFGLYCGRRVNEIVGLTWDRVNFEFKTIMVQSTNTKSKKKQYFPINKNMLALLEAAKKARQKSKYSTPWVFPCSTGKYHHSFDRNWRDYRDEMAAGIDMGVGENGKKRELRIPKNFRFHDLRHTYASHLASSGEVTLFQLQKLLGHNDLRMTERYAHLIPGALDKPASVADKLFKAITE